MQRDVIVIGGGPGGYVAAIRCAQLGLKTCLVEVDHLGGICLNWGCIPTKALLCSSEQYHLVHNAEQFGFEAEIGGFELDGMIARSRKVAGQLSKGVKHLLAKNGVEVIAARARLASADQIELEDADGILSYMKARNIIIATGARATEPAGMKANGRNIWTYRHALNPPSMPRNLLIIGSGAIGMEFASFYRDLGAEVTVVEMASRILPGEDTEISQAARELFEKRGIEILTDARVSGLKDEGSVVTAQITLPTETITRSADTVLLSVGITGNIENLGLDEVGVALTGSHIDCDQYGATSVPGVWAIGDVAGAPWLAHKASHEGVMVAERIAGSGHVQPLDIGAIPSCTYSRPQIASIGLSEAGAREQKRSVKVGRFPFLANGKALAMGETDGFIKTIFDADTGALLGAHMLGAEVTELIQGFALAIKLEATEEEIMETIFAHPTLSESMHESVLDAYDRAIHF